MTIGHDETPGPVKRPAADSARGATNAELAEFLSDWAAKIERERLPGSVPGYQWALDGLREAGRRLLDLDKSDSQGGDAPSLGT